MEYAEISEMRECKIKETNRLIKEGWILIKPPVKMSQKDKDDYILYVLAK